MKTNNIRNLTVGTMKKSIDTRSRTCWSRNVLHVGDGGPVRLGLYFSTVDLATSIPRHREFSNDPRRAPRWIGLPHLPNKLSEFWRNLRSACFARLTECAPVVAESLFLPIYYGPGLNKVQDFAPALPVFCYAAPEQPVSWPDSWPLP